MTKFTRNTRTPFEPKDRDQRKDTYRPLARLVGVTEKNYDAWWEGYRHIANARGAWWDALTPGDLKGAYEAKDGMRK